MNELFEKIGLSAIHLKSLNEFFENINNYNIPLEEQEYKIYHENLQQLEGVLSNLNFYDQLYGPKERQMILADLFEYIFLGRGFYAIGRSRNNVSQKEWFIKSILHLTNLLMCFESITVNANRRQMLLAFLISKIPSIGREDGYSELLAFQGEVGIPGSSATPSVSKYFDKLLPKTAGGLWHELLVYIFVLRNNLGYILPLLLHQKIYSKSDHLVPPDFLILTKDKRIFGIEVGIKKEIQSGSFSLKTAIPTATIDTINSRNSDRCPICKKWILFCPVVINKFSDYQSDISKTEIRCLNECTVYSRADIVAGKCNYTKYSRNIAATLSHTNHNYSDGKHYHYSCVLDNVDPQVKLLIIQAEDVIAIKTHLPYYSGLDELFE